MRNSHLLTLAYAEIAKVPDHERFTWLLSASASTGGWHDIEDMSAAAIQGSAMCIEAYGQVAFGFGADELVRNWMQIVEDQAQELSAIAKCETIIRAPEGIQPADLARAAHMVRFNSKDTTLRLAAKDIQHRLAA